MQFTEFPKVAALATKRSYSLWQVTYELMQFVTDLTILVMLSYMLWQLLYL